MAIEHATRHCTLEAAVGKIEACPENACPFWEPGGAALGGRCAFEQLDVATDASLAAWLLEIRERLASAESTAATAAAHSLFSHLLNESAE
jgi:DNA-binding SARP family transcriptional activator